MSHASKYGFNLVHPDFAIEQMGIDAVGAQPRDRFGRAASPGNRPAIGDQNPGQPGRAIAKPETEKTELGVG